MMIVAVIGGGKCTPKTASLAEEVGQELAKHDAALICGGLGGVMKSACRGACQAGGQTIGVLPGNNPADANDYVQIPIVTGMGEMRNVIIIKSAQAVIAIDGEFGTLSEIGHALANGLPVIGLDTWELYKNGKPDKSVILAKDAKDAVNKALSEAQKELEEAIK